MRTGCGKAAVTRFGMECLEDRITPATPTVTGLNPTFGPTVGGTPVTISGTNFTGATVVDFGPNAATNLTVVSATTITARQPGGHRHGGRDGDDPKWDVADQPRR